MTTKFISDMGPKSALIASRPLWVRHTEICFYCICTLENMPMFLCIFCHGFVNTSSCETILLCPPTKGEGAGTYWFMCESWAFASARHFVSTIFLESMGGILPYLHGYIIGTSQRAGTVWVTLTPFVRS